MSERETNQTRRRDCSRSAPKAILAGRAAVGCTLSLVNVAPVGRRPARALAATTIAATLPLWAHGEELAVVFFGALVLVPLVVLLFIPWRFWWVRVTAIAAFAVFTAVLWTAVLPRVESHTMSSVAEWLLLLSPAICALAVGVALRNYGKRRAA